MKTAAEFVFDSTTPTGIIGSVAYDSSKIMLGSLFTLNTGSTAASNYIGPDAIAQIKIGEVAAFSTFYPHVVPYSSRYNWVFTFDSATAAATRRIVFIEHDLQLNTFTYKGFIIRAGTRIAGNKTIRGGRAAVYTHTTGTVAVTASTTVNGTGTQFLTERFAAGARIGFGSTDPTQISTWYNITAVLTETTLTIDQSITVPAGTSYVVEEIRIYLAETNATAANGGVFVIKGLNYSTFIPAGTTIAENADNFDNKQGVYWLKDQVPTVTTQQAAGIALSTAWTSGSHDLFYLNHEATARATMVKFNARANVSGSLSGSGTSGCYLFRTGSATLNASHVVSQLNNLKLFTVQSGVASGSPSLYFCSSFTSTSRVNRCPTTGSLFSGSTSFVADGMLEVPPGGSTTFPLTNSLAQADYSDSVDRILIATGVTPFKIYITPYVTDNSQFLDVFSADIGQLVGSTSDSGISTLPVPRGAAWSIWTESGYLYMLCTSTTTTGINNLYAVPLKTDWTYSPDSNQYVITPKIATANATKLYRAYANSMKLAGTSDKFAVQPEPFRWYVRTSGIDDNSGSWTLINDDGDISGIAASTYIQFKIEFKIKGIFMIPNRIYSLVVTFENDSQDSHYQPSLTFSSTADRQFAWKQVQSWGGTIPNLRIRLYDANGGAELLNDTSSGPTLGTWTYSSNSGSTWNAWLTSGPADSVGNYIRYTAGSVPNNITARVLLTQV